MARSNLPSLFSSFFPSFVFFALVPTRTQVLIFSQFIGMLDMVQEFLSLRGHKHERLDGRTTGNERQKSIDRFANACRSQLCRWV